MFESRTSLLFFSCLKVVAGAALKNAAPAPSSDQQKNPIRIQAAPQHCRYRYDTGTFLTRFKYVENIYVF